MPPAILVLAHGGLELYHSKMVYHSLHLTGQYNLPYDPTNWSFFGGSKESVKLFAQILEKVCLVGGFNPFEKYSPQIGSFPNKMFETTT